MIVHYSSSCNDDNSNHIGIYRGYNTDSLFRRVCGNRRLYQFTYDGQYIYITFHTTSEANTQRNTGFSRIEFVARGLFIATIKLLATQMNKLFQTLMSVDQIIVIMNVRT